VWIAAIESKILLQNKSFIEGTCMFFLQNQQTAVLFKLSSPAAEAIYQKPLGTGVSISYYFKTQT
jgi:hypothetical protein